MIFVVKLHVYTSLISPAHSICATSCKPTKSIMEPTCTNHLQDALSNGSRQFRCQSIRCKHSLNHSNHFRVEVACKHDLNHSLTQSGWACVNGAIQLCVYSWQYWALMVPENNGLASRGLTVNHLQLDWQKLPSWWAHIINYSIITT